jgi:hypothetical protein
MQRADILWETGIAYPSRVHGFTPDFGGSVLLIVLVFYVVFFFAFVSDVPGFSGLSILDCTFGLLWRLLTFLDVYVYIYPI